MAQLLAIIFREVLIFKRKFVKQIFSFMVSPLLFLITFGWGFGNEMNVDGVPYINFILPGIIAMASMRQSFALSSEINISRFYWKTFDEIQSAPISNISYTAGEVISGMLRGCLAAVVVMILALIFQIGISINGLFVASLLLNTFIFSSMAVITSMVVKTHAEQGMLNNFLITPMAFLCGTFFPIQHYPLWVGKLIFCLPLTHVSATVRAALLNQKFPYFSLLYMAVFGAVVFIVAVKVIRNAKN
ncbi:MAG: ABC transporter permease [Candidatus Omnitrophica bacterium]|nr:ABC transporter permease [Candidatus Omnitrophota bacterium]